MAVKKVDFTTVSIPKPLADKINKMREGTGFTSLSSFVEYLLREIVIDAASKDTSKNAQVKNVEERLRKLGYM